MTRRWVAGAVLTVACAAGCSVSPRISDTGYQGTWRRSNERVTSTLAIVIAGDDAWFRWGARSADGLWVVRCEWEGSCTEYQGEEKISEYTYRAWIDPETRRLMVEGRRHILPPEEREVRWVDELLVSDEGRTLTSSVVEREGESGPGPVYTFEKVADAVADPPRGLSGGTGQAVAEPEPDEAGSRG